MSDCTWEIDGYLLGDPSVDRASFEQRMLDDPEFALRVAEAAETLDFFAVATRTTKPLVARVDRNSATIISSQHSLATFNWKAALAIAATLIVGVAATVFFQGTQKRGYDAFANSWLAMEQEVLPADSALVENAVQDGLLDHQPDIAASNLEDDDWLIDSAIAFYSDNEF